MVDWKLIHSAQKERTNELSSRVLKLKPTIYDAKRCESYTSSSCLFVVPLTPTILGWVWSRLPIVDQNSSEQSAGKVSIIVRHKKNTHALLTILVLDRLVGFLIEQIGHKVVSKVNGGQAKDERWTSL